MKTLVVDNFVTMVRAKKFSLGKISDYRTVGDVVHFCDSENHHVCTNLVSSASIYLPWNNTVATTITWHLKHLSQYFAIYPLKSDQMNNNILFNVTWLMCQEDNLGDLKFDQLTFLTVMNEASKNKLDDRSGVHAENLHLLDSIYGLKNIDYVCLKVLGCHHSQYEDDGGIAFGLNLGGFFCPVSRASSGQQGFRLESEDDNTSENDTSEDDIIYLKTFKKGVQGKFTVFRIRKEMQLLLLSHHDFDILDEIQKKHMTDESVQGSSPDLNENIFKEDEYSHDFSGDDAKNEDDYSELVDANDTEDERYSSEFVDEIDNEDDANSLSSETDESEDDSESDDSDVRIVYHRESYSEVDEEDSDEGGSSDSGSSGIIPIHGAQVLVNAADDHDVIFMERVSPEPGM
jgi:hypothetical protein